MWIRLFALCFTGRWDYLLSGVSPLLYQQYVFYRWCMYKCNATSSSCCKMLFGKTFVCTFFFFLLSKKGCSCTSCILSTQTEAEIAASERGVRKGPRLGYCCHQFSPGPTRVGSISHLFSGAGTLVVSPCPPRGKRGDEEGAPGRRQLLLGLREQLWEQPLLGFSAERLFSWTGLASPVPAGL